MHPPTPQRADRLEVLRADVAALRGEAIAAERAADATIAAVHTSHRAGAANLAHYLALRSHDLRELQGRLSAEGLSSLGRMEPDVLGNLDAVLAMLDDALRPEAENTEEPVSHATALRELGIHAAQLLGGTPDDRSTRIMVTLPGQAADHPDLVSAYARAGMDVARINCAHDGPEAWARMAAHVRATDAGIPVAMDLAGPKLRTGPIAPGPRVAKVRPTRDELGRVTQLARLWLTAPDAETGPLDGVIAPIDDADWLAGLSFGDEVHLFDTRDRERTLPVAEIRDGAVLVTVDRTSYLATGTELAAPHGIARIGALPPVERALRIHVGDTVTLTTDLTPVAATDAGDHRIGCTLPEALESVREGDRVAFDDGVIEGVVTATGEDEASVEITLAAPGGTKLRAEKGINLPDTDLPVGALTDEDDEALVHVMRIADIVQLSFVRSATDVRALFDRLEEHESALGVVVKIETTRGFAALPEIVFELMRRPRVGVMIARGDLGVEAGFERLAEVQEEILWLCEAARIPVIWATQVLDSLAGSGVPTRAEVTDAAAGDRAECVMLNKGPYITDAIEALDDILRRMHEHLEKKRPLLRRLGSWQRDG
ncbi:pyruvate kinase [Microbacterium sp. X-17]|uniref:pyruvate kinase n=1 Tax=Microbacterium sp. X-17 TaxID=3144404 RepID=UPI0031F5A1C5